MNYIVKVAGTQYHMVLGSPPWELSATTACVGVSQLFFFPVQYERNWSSKMSIQSTFPVLRFCVDIYKEIIQYYLLLYFFLEKYETEEKSMILAYGYSTSAPQNLVKLFARGMCWSRSPRCGIFRSFLLYSVILFSWPLALLCVDVRMAFAVRASIDDLLVF